MAAAAIAIPTMNLLCDNDEEPTILSSFFFHLVKHQG